MMTRKIMYGIAAKEYEDYLTQIMHESGIEPIIVKAVTYREAILEYLPGSGAEILIFRDSLNGSVDIGKILEQVRVDYPDLQVIFICATGAADPILAKCVTLGIYDIINSNSVRAQEIVRHILHPGNFHDVYQYYRFSNADVPQQAEIESEQPRKRRGLLASFFGLSSETTSQASPEMHARGNLALPAPSKEPKIDQDLMREAIYENAVRDAQANMDELIRKAVDKETEALKTEKATIEKELADTKLLMSQRENRTVDLMNQLNEEKTVNEELTKENERLIAESKKTLSIYEEQINQLRSDRDTPEWYAQQEENWGQQEADLCQRIVELIAQVERLTSEKETLERQIEEKSDGSSGNADTLVRSRLTAEKEALQSKLNARESELRTTQAELRRMRSKLSELETENARLNDLLSFDESMRSDYSYPALSIPTATGSPNGAAHTSRAIAFIGAKHGVGNTTVAMNVAASFAGQGEKVILVEINDRFPLCNEYFELTNVPRGFNAAMMAVREGDTLTADSTIIRFRALRPRYNGIAKAYRRLPTGFHLLTYSNEDLIDAMHGARQPVTESALKLILEYLTKRQQYARVILDLQPDDHAAIQALIRNAYIIDKLALCIGQDSHSVSTAGILISNLCKSDAVHLVSGAELVVNKFNQSAAVTPAQIARTLNVQSDRIHTLSEDTLGYLDAMGNAVPYVINGGVFSKEYEILRGKVGT